MNPFDEQVEVVVLSSTGLTRALVSAGLTDDQAKAATKLFMPHLRAQECAEAATDGESGPAKGAARRNRIVGRRAGAFLSLLDKELGRLCSRAEEEQIRLARRGSGIAALRVMKDEHQARAQALNALQPLWLDPDMRVMPSTT